MADGAENINTNVERSKPDDNKSKGSKTSVLEKHGYTIGRSIGSGSYATVKVMIVWNNNSIVVVRRGKTQKLNHDDFERNIDYTRRPHSGAHWWVQQFFTKRQIQSNSHAQQY